VTAYLTEKQTPYQDLSTPEGIYNIKLILTRDKRLAEDASTNLRKQILEARLGGVPLMENLES
jgi:hypothetical protein